ncbi:uncharacterized protein ACIBXB_012284 isoform 7-T7 [Morphnus guianensis]
MDAGPPRVIGGCPAAWPVCQRGVCAARAGTVLTIRKQLHPALRGQDHCPGTYQEPSSDPFQKRTLPASIMRADKSDSKPWKDYMPRSCPCDGKS